MSEHYSIPNQYAKRSKQPLQSLFFLLPFILLYELGIIFLEAGLNQRDIFARSLLRKFFQMFDVTGYHLPAVIAIVVLLSLHVAKGDRFRIDFKLYVAMFFESFLIALPLYVFSLVLFRYPALQAVMLQATAAAGEPTTQAGDAQEIGWQAMLFFSMGAGIYEELLFRLIGIAVLHLLFDNLLALPKKWSAWLAVIGSSIAFAFYHFDSQTNPFTWGLFLFYTVAGMYFAGIYLWRGFGIAAGVHAMYDALAVLLPVIQETMSS